MEPTVPGHYDDTINVLFSSSNERNVDAIRLQAHVTVAQADADDGNRDAAPNLVGIARRSQVLWAVVLRPNQS